MVLRPGGTYDSSPAIYRRVRKHKRPASRRDARIRRSAFAKLNRFSREISIVPPGQKQILNTGTGDKSPAYFLVVPPGHIDTATGLNVEMCNRDRSKFSLSSRHSDPSPDLLCLCVLCGLCVLPSVWSVPSLDSGCYSRSGV